MLYKCLLSMMSEEGHAKTTVWKSEYHVSTRPSGVLLLSVMIRELHIDTNAMASLICHQMANIKDYIINPSIAEAAEISDDNESVVDPHDDLDSQEGWSSDKSQSTDHDVWHTEKPRTFNLVGETSSPPNPIVIVDEEDKTGNQTPTTELLLYHYRFGHISFTKLQLMAKFGILPKCLATCNVPLCSACMYAKATKRPWRAKTKTSNIPIRTPPPPATSFQWTKWNHQSLAW